MALNTSKSAMQTIGNYELLEKVAEGGMGSVWRARHLETGQIVAIKIMPAHMASNATLLKRFEQEFRAASRLDHPNIVRALDYGGLAFEDDKPATLRQGRAVPVRFPTSHRRSSFRPGT